MNLLTHKLLVGYSNGDVAIPLRDRRASTFWAGAEAIEERRAVDFNRGDSQLVDVGAMVVFGIRDR
jgi:hypothetical protein